MPWYKSQGISSVDDLDALAGQAALVYALAGSHGTYGDQVHRGLAAAGRRQRLSDLSRRPRRAREASAVGAVPARRLASAPVASFRSCTPCRSCWRSLSAAILAPAVLRALSAGGHTQAQLPRAPAPFPLRRADRGRGADRADPAHAARSGWRAREVFHPEAAPDRRLRARRARARPDRRHARRGSPARAPARSSVGPAAIRRGWRGARHAARRCAASCPRGRSRPPARSAWRCSR